MAFKKIMIDLGGNLYDLWHLVSAEAFEEYNQFTNTLEFGIVLNRTAISRDYSDVRVFYDSLEERNQMLSNIRKILAESQLVFFVNDLKEDEELTVNKTKKKKSVDFNEEEEDLELDDDF